MTPSTIPATAPRGRMVTASRAFRIAVMPNQHAAMPTAREKTTR